MLIVIERDVLGELLNIFGPGLGPSRSVCADCDGITRK